MAFTHTLKFNVGGVEHSGDAEFNNDGLASFKLDNNPAGFTLSQDSSVHDFMKELKRIFDEFGSIEDIRIKKNT
ncbi:MAG: hypothetical protein NUV73_00135 [Candidatus Daviesbacteria bacterium]|nr:hypothetical protein [Candidatus Daviesbacteria bacterium]